MIRGLITQITYISYVVQVKGWLKYIYAKRKFLTKLHADGNKMFHQEDMMGIICRVSIECELKQKIIDRKIYSKN